jgi:ribosomal protein S18 acetylase RimI-like enzyme
MDEIAIERVSVEDLRADKSGDLIEQLASLAYRAFREPPWSDDLERPRLHLGLGVDLMRRNALAFIARDAGRIAGYALGYEVFRDSPDPRDLTLGAISGTAALDYLFEDGSRVFYGDTLCVDPGTRRRQIAFRLVAAQMTVLRREGFTYRIGRTSLDATAMRGLFAKLGFEELAVRDAVFADRSYWLLTL